MQRFTFHKLSVLVLLLSLSVGLQTCAVNPVTGKRQVSFISEQQEIQMGQSYDPQVIAEMGLYVNPKLQQFLSQKGQAMAAISERPQLPWSFKLVDSPVVNAFAVPGGFVYFTRGIMAHFNNEAQFAGVLGHEIGHVTARHTVQQQSRQTLAQIGLIGGMVLSPELASQGEGLMQGMQLLFLKFGRDAESQSDQLGVIYSTKIGYDAKEMAGFFTTLSRLSGGAENRVPTFLSTHPDPDNREVTVRQLAQQAQANLGTTNLEVGRNSYLQMIDGMIYGEDPKQGFVEAGSFYHPELRFQFKIPGQWQLLNSPSQVQMVSPDQKSVMQMRLAQGTDQNAAAQSFIQEAKVQGAQVSNQAINGLPAATVLGDVVQQSQDGSQSQTIRVLASFISYGGNTYMLLGMALAPDFSRYQRDIEYTLSSFAKLTDASKLNRQAEQIKIVTSKGGQTLQQALLASGLPQDRLNEVAILNGMELTQTLPAGLMFKTLTGGSLR
ncbi:M48 family metalloprotease [Neolewinella lacunae]|uniref:M48 family metalloprotease n=1 Tax=Neolewinella lacunae TaxID=1517758 RepID=A0A923T8H6_9BACT|nr:M48 family metalloprotease [Neolewinella lacunae]MBC6995635.1 M48 family metalloprotease [Neolewinella lacunae]MDN3634298.1 M48 family metalloprotease [Neolewinella lacunae]